MLTINKLREFLVETKTAIETINFAELVVDDSQFLKCLQNIKESDNYLLIGVVPQFPLNGNEDTFKWNNQLQFFILKKITDRNSSHSLLLDILEETQKTTIEFVNLLLGEKIGEDNQICGLSNEYVPGSLLVQPVWEKASCHGWVIELDLLTKV